MNDEWISLTGYIDPPLAPEGYTTEVKRDSFLGIMTHYRFIPLKNDYDDKSKDELLEMIRELKKEVKTLKLNLLNRSWAENPDRMGGQFTEEEKNRRNFY